MQNRYIHVAGGCSCALTTVAIETSVGARTEFGVPTSGLCRSDVIPMSSYTFRSNELALSVLPMLATLGKPPFRFTDFRSGSEVRRATRHGRSR